MTKAHMIKKLKDQIGKIVYMSIPGSDEGPDLVDEADLELSGSFEVYLNQVEPGEVVVALEVKSILQAEKPSIPKLTQL